MEPLQPPLDHAEEICASHACADRECKDAQSLDLTLSVRGKSPPQTASAQVSSTQTCPWSPGCGRCDGMDCSWLQLVAEHSHVVACGRPCAVSPSIQMYRAQSLGCSGSGYLSRSVPAFEGVVKLLLRGDSHRGPRQ